MAPDTATVEHPPIHKPGFAEDSKKEGDDDLRLWSVTTIIGIVTGWGLENWKTEQPIRFALDELEEHGDKAPWLARFRNEGVDSAVDYLTAFRWDDEALASTELGTAVHTACEHYALTGQRPDAGELAKFVDWAQEKRKPKDKLATEIVNTEAAAIGVMLDRFDAFLDAYQPAYIAAEVTCYSPTYGYAGTCDGFMEIGGTPLIFDYKTSRDDLTKHGNPKKPYSDAGLQLAAYRYSEMAAVWRVRRGSYYRRRYYYLNETEREMAVPVPPVEGGLVIFITPERCEPFPVRCNEAVFEAFLARLDDARFEFEVAKDVVGNPLVPAGGGS